MKKILMVIIIAGFLGITGVPAMADDKPAVTDRNEVICVCCGEIAVECGCPTAQQILKEFDKKTKGI